MKKRRCFALGTAAAVLLTAMPVLPVTAQDEVLKFEFEDGQLVDCENSEPITWEQVDEDAEGNPCDMTGWSGDSYVYIDDKDSYVSLKVQVPQEGFYALGIAYIQCFGVPHKIQYLQVNGESQGEICFNFNSGKGWELMDAGYLHLNAGENEIRIVSYWGYTFLDYLTLSPAPSYVTNLSATPNLCNPNASPEAKKVYAYLRSVYGEHTLSGQQEYCGSHCYNKDSYVQQGLPVNYFEDNEAEFEYIQDVTGKQPAIRGIDFLFYNTTSPYFDDAPERVIAWYKEKGGIPTVTYHWNVPLEKGSDSVSFYVESSGNTPFTTFSVTNAVTEGTWEREQIDKDLALLAEQFQKIEDAGVPVIFRPLHEAEGGWFWWGAEGPEACKELYHYVWETLTNTYGLDNIIWEWTGYTYATSPDWYPGDEYVDLIGYDKYNAINNNDPNPSAISATFYSLVSQTEGEKMVCMSENDTIPALDKLVESKAAWLYFCPWYQRYLTELNDKNELKKIYNSDYCITLDELPDWDTYDPGDVPSTTTTAASETTTTTTSTQTAPSETTTTAPQNLMWGDVNTDGNVSVQDAILTARLVLGAGDVQVSDTGRQNAECDGDGTLTNGDVTRLLSYLVSLSPAGDA